MKRVQLLYISVILFLLSGSALAHLGVIHRIPHAKNLSRQKRDPIDFNMNLCPEVIYIDSAGVLHIFDPCDDLELWTYPLSNLKPSIDLGNTDVNLFGIMMENGKAMSHAIISTRDAASGVPKDLYIIDTADDAVELFMEDVAPIAILVRPGTGDEVLALEKIEIAIEQAERIIMVIGEVGNSTAGASTTGAVWQPAKMAADYQLELKFQAEPGLRLAYDPDLFNPRHDMDIDGDEHMDTPMIIEDPNANNEPIGVVVRGGANFDVLWRFPFPQEHKENILKGFHGFVDANGDGFEDIIGLNTIDSTIVVYGVMTATSVAGADPAAIHFRLFQNYPNPFNPSTTISYTVAEAGEVKLTVYNQLGQTVRTLFSGQKPAGEYSLNWDGRDDAGRFVSSGSYFYRLKLGEAIQTRRMLFLK